VEPVTSKKPYLFRADFNQDFNHDFLNRGTPLLVLTQISEARRLILHSQTVQSLAVQRSLSGYVGIYHTSSEEARTE